MIRSALQHAGTGLAALVGSAGLESLSPDTELTGPLSIGVVTVIASVLVKMNQRLTRIEATCSERHRDES